MRRRVEGWEKVQQTGVLFADFWEFWRTKADGLGVDQKRNDNNTTPITQVIRRITLPCRIMPSLHPSSLLPAQHSLF